MATYNPYGVENASISAEYKFTNQIRDPNGIDHFWMRSYSATLGRWLTPDPAGLAAVDPTNPQSWNRYAYVLNNPASAIDPLGLSTHACGGSTSGGINFCTDVSASYTPMPAPNYWGPGGEAQNMGNYSSLNYDGGIAIPSHPSGGGGFDFSTLPVAQKKDRVCYGKARVLRGNANFLGRDGALGFIGYHTAAISYEQFGFRSSIQMERSGGISNISGVVGIGPFGPDFSFTLSDINGGRVHPGFPNVRAMLRSRYPGQLLVELPGLPGTNGDPGTQPVMMLVPWRWKCPEGTHV